METAEELLSETMDVIITTSFLSLGAFCLDIESDSIDSLDFESMSKAQKILYQMGVYSFYKEAETLRKDYEDFCEKYNAELHAEYLRRNPNIGNDPDALPF